jgi:hypothetical protein
MLRDEFGLHSVGSKVVAGVGTIEIEKCNEYKECCVNFKECIYVSVIILCYCCLTC